MRTLATILATILGSTALLLGGTTAPLVSVPMHWDYAYQGDIHAATTTPAFIVPEAGTTTASVAVFTNQAGNQVLVQIPNSQYHQMGQRGGSSVNPAQTEMVSLASTMVGTAHAFSVARDANTQNQALSALSITFSKTNTGSNLYLVVAAVDQQSTGNISGVTYNGVSLTQFGTTQTVCAQSGQQMSTWGLVAPASGANNVVVTRSTAASTWLAADAASYTGVNQSTPTEGTNSSSVNGLTASYTTAVNNDWGILNACNTASGGGTPAAGAGSSVVFSGYFDQETLFDTNAPVGTGSNSMTFTASGGSGRWNVFALEPAPGSAIQPDDSTFIIFN